MAADGRFRSDLFFRIAQIRIVSPPLRERNGDIMLLAHHFLATNSAQFGGAKVFAPTAEALLAGYAYPGNVRELQAIVERAVLLSGERAMIEAEDLALVAPAKSPEFDVSGFALPKACDRFEASLITRRSNSAGDRAVSPPRISASRCAPYPTRCGSSASMGQKRERTHENRWTHDRPGGLRHRARLGRTPALPEIDACRATRDRVGRLLCFDALFKTPVEDSAAETPPPETAKVIRKPSPLRELGLDQERGRPDGVAGALVRIRPWRSAAFVEPTTFEGILTGRAGQSADLPADQRAWTADTADVFLTLREGDGVSPLGRGTLDQRSVIMLACEDDITAFYILLPKPVGHARTKFALTTDRV